MKRMRGVPLWLTQEPPVIDGRMPPNDIAAEAAVISASLHDSTARDIALSTVASGDFYSAANADIWRAIEALSQQQADVDAVTVMHQLRAMGRDNHVGGASYLATLLDATPAVGNVQSHADVVADMALRRRVVAACQLIASHGYDPAVSDTYVDDAVQAVTAASIGGKDKGHPVPLKSLLPALAAQQHDPTATAVQRVLVGMHPWDRGMDNGGMGRGWLITVAARPGMGKTALTLQLCTAVALRGQWVARFDLEMTKEECVARMVAQEARVHLSKVQNLAKASAAEASRVTAAMDRLDTERLWVHDAPNLSVEEIRSRTKWVAAKAKRAGSQLGLVVIDYLQLIRHSPGAQTRDEGVGMITRALKAMAKELGVPVVLLSQLNRGVEGRQDKRPMLSDLRESGNIEQDCDVVVFVYRDGYYKRDPSNTDAELVFAKHRHGKTGVMAARWLGYCMAFEDEATVDDVPDDEDIPL